jgi:arylsulfatase A-like enzyme
MKRLGFAQRTLGEDDLAVSRAATKYHAEVYHRLRQDALQTVRDPRLNLVFLHFNVPHFPPIYDAAKQSYSTSLDGTFEGTYKDNLALVDHTLGEIRQTLEQAGTWDSTTILLTSDHPFRVSLWRSWSRRFSRLAYSPQSSRVPFLLKMAGEKQGVDYPRAIQTVVTKDLLLEVLNQKVTTAVEVAAWLDHNPPRR